MLLITIIFIVATVVLYKKFSKNKDHEHVLALLLELKSIEPKYKQAIRGFNSLKDTNWYVSDRQYQLWKNKYKYLAEKYNPIFSEINTKDSIKSIVVNFAECYFNGRKIFIDEYNENFVQQEYPTIKNILDEKGVRYNNDQINAIASDEDNTLLVAGAGTGKTTTILGKLAYLIERAGIDPEEILLLSFTGRAVDELTERIHKTFPDKKIKAQTFHSFGLSVIGEALGKRPDLAFTSTSSRQKFLDEQFNLQLKDADYLHCAVEYFAYYFKPIVLEPSFQTLDEYYKYSRTEQHLTLKKEYLKSQQEVMIANFLYMNGINYEYEKPYKYDTADKDYSQYKPDFYLSDYGVYIEHFGVDRDGRTHFTGNIEQNRLQTSKYQLDMSWKRGMHSQHETPLIETFSYEFNERDWKEKLTSKLKKHNIEFSSRNKEEITSDLKSSSNVKEISQLFGVFLGLAKSNGYSVEKIQDIILPRNDPREMAFYDIFAPIFLSYEEYLTHNNKIDFDDMLINSSRFVNDGLYKHNYKYIIIDEFQDFSVSKYLLVKSLCDQSPDTKLFCVGDDWQSIFRFSGSDISLMANFEQNYGFTRKKQLVLTNRFANGLAVVSNKFILKNPSQIKKVVQSSKIEEGDPVEIRYHQKKSDTDELICKILSTISRVASNDKKVSVFLLGRYNYNKPENFSSYLKEYKNLSIEFLTIHASKGAEADYVIILDVISGKHGFPSEITDDPLLEIVLSKSDSYPHAEERRLMYVAMTRARHKVYIVTEDGKQSVFVLELEGSKKSTTEIDKICEECGGIMVQRKGTYGTFWGCSNFPECVYTIKNSTRRKY